MPLMLCPNDNGSMQSVQRSGVEFDMCPTCRGVWLDRGELEKLLEVARGDPDHAPQAGGMPWPRPDPGQRPPRRYEGHYRRDDDEDGYRRKKKRESIFDIFD